MRLLLVALATLVLALVLGYEPSFAPTFRTTFPENPGRDEGTVDLSALPVVLHDLTGSVAAIAVVEPPIYDGGDVRGRVAQVDGDPTAIRIDWLAGACEGRVTVLVTGAGDRYSLTVKSHLKLWTIACPGLGIARSLIVRFKQPVVASQFALKSPLDD